VEKIWLKSYDPGVPHEISDYPATKTLISLFDEAVASFSKRSALVYLGKYISYKELDRLSRGAAMLLQSLGVKPGDRVVLHLPNIPQFVIAYLGILRLGAIAVPVNPLYHDIDLNRVLEKTQPRAIITLTKFVESIHPVTKQFLDLLVLAVQVKEYLPFLKRFLFTLCLEKKGGHRLPDRLGNTLNFDHLLRKQVAHSTEMPADSEERTAVIQCTGGVTGEPKPTELTNRNLVSNCVQIGRWLEVLFEKGEETVAAVAPLFHIYGLTSILNLGLISGSTIVLIPDPRDLKMILKEIRKNQATILPAVPWHFEKWLQMGIDLKQYFRSVKLCVSGGSAIAIETINDFEKKSGSRLIQGYGLSEASPTTHINPIVGRHKTGSVGLPLPDTKVKIIDPETRQEVGPGIIGELYISGPQVGKGYFNDPEATEAIFDDGWLKTGDIFYYDDDGHFFPVDRAKDMIYVGHSGFKVYPTQIEAVVKEHPLVEDVAIVGKQLPEGGEVPVMFIVPKPTGPEVNVAEELCTFCKHRLVHYKVPREIIIVEMIPKTVLGKPIRRLLRN